MTIPAQADIVERLRKGRLALLGHEIFEAADLIESLRADIEALRAKLAEAMEALEGAEAFIEQNYEPAYDSDLLKEVRRARRLVEEGNHG